MLSDANLLNNQQLKEYEEEGYIHIKKAVDDQLISLAIKAYERMRIKCETKKYNHLRRYNNYLEEIFMQLKIFFTQTFLKKTYLNQLFKAKF